jgi:cytochrome c-type biogenesis protein CcmH/NrfF
MRRLVLVTTIFAISWAPATAVATPEDVANDISSEIMSPYCPGVTLHDCPSEQAIALRERIVAWAAAGWSRGRILETLEAEFGPQIRAVPPAEGKGILAWLLPALGAVAGVAVAWTVARRWSSRGRFAASPAPPARASEEDRMRVNAELARLREIQRW